MAGEVHSGLERRAVEVAAYDPDWARRFDSLARAMRSALGRVAVRIEHVGSTSVPGLPAKPVIDIQLSVSAFEPWAACAGPLEALGYIYRADDDAPEEHRFFRLNDGNGRVANLHLCLAASEWEHRHLTSISATSSGRIQISPASTARSSSGWPRPSRTTCMRTPRARRRSSGGSSGWLTAPKDRTAASWWWWSRTIRGGAGRSSASRS